MIRNDSWRIIVAARKPISDHAESVMRSLPLPAQEINPGVRWRLEKGGYVEQTKGVSPYKTHKGGMIDFYDLTDKGRRYLADGI